MYTGDMLGGVSKIQTKNKKVKFGSNVRLSDVGVTGEHNCLTLDALL